MSRSLPRFTAALVLLSTGSLIALTGCGAATSFSNPTASSRVSGKVFGGQQPVAGSTVSVWAVGLNTYGETNPLPLATTATLSDGSFSFPGGSYTCTAGEQVYITAAGGNAAPDFANPNIMLAAGLGDCTAAQSAVVEINEVTTAVTAFALAQFFTATAGEHDGFGTDPADLPAFTLSNQYLIPTLIDVPTGTVKPSTPAITIEAAKIYSIANTLAACVNDAGDFSNCGKLLGYTERPGGGLPIDTFQAAINMALYPYQNVTDLWKLASARSPFVGLSTAPNDWTLAVSYTSSNYALGIAGTASSSTSASIDIDVSGRVWFPTTLANSTGVAYFDPASASFNGPYLTGQLTQPQYVAIDPSDVLIVTDVASPTLALLDTTAPTSPGHSATVPFTLRSATALGPVAADTDNFFVFSFLTPAGTAYLGGFGGTILDAGVPYTYPPTGLAEVNNLYSASTSGSSTPCASEIIAENNGFGDVLGPVTPDNCTSGGVAFASRVQDVLSAATSSNVILSILHGPLSVPALNLPEGIATDGHGNEWVANSGNASITTFGGIAELYGPVTPVAYLHDAADGNTMTAPYAVAIDGSGNVWTANAGCVTMSATPCTPGAFVLSELIGAAAPTIAPLSAQSILGGALIGSPPGTTPVPPTTPTAHTHQQLFKHQTPTSGASFIPFLGSR